MGFFSSTSSVTPGTHYRDVGSETKWATPAPSLQVGVKSSSTEHRLLLSTLAVRKNYYESFLDAGALLGPKMHQLTFCRQWWTPSGHW